MKTIKKSIYLLIFIFITNIFVIYGADPIQTNQEIVEQTTQNTCIGNLNNCIEVNRNLTNENAKLIEERDYYKNLYLNSTYNITNKELINIFNLYNQTINNYNQSIQEINQNIKHIEYKFYFVFILFIVIELGLLGFNWHMNNNFETNVDLKIHNEMKNLKTNIINIIKEEKDENKIKQKHK